MTVSLRHPDRRVARTRQLLQQACKDVMREKGFEATTIYDITQRANVNRGTFYLHFADKYMLVDAFVREDFQQVLACVLPEASGWNRDTLHLLITTLIHHFEQKYRHQRRVTPAVAPLIERAIHEELTGVLLTWLQRHEASDRWQVPMETIARIVSWAIFGTVIEWSQAPQTVSPEQLTQALLAVIMEGIANVAPQALPT